MRINLLFLAALMISAAGYSQNTLTGTITSKKDNQPVLGTVYITQLEKGVDTDFDGNYELKNIPDGSFDIIFSALGYNSRSEEHTSELQSRPHLVCRLLLEKKKKKKNKKSKTKKIIMMTR